MNRYLPCISILTPSYNQGEYIERNILSVLHQQYPNTEHIIIDGGSNDQTIPILKKYRHLKWISEKDEGQSDALIKGLSLSSGEIIGWLNSDDYYLDGVFWDLVQWMSDPTVNWIYGRLKFNYEESGLIEEKKRTVITYRSLLKNPFIVQQPNTFFRKSFIDTNGWVNKNYHMIMDYDLWIRYSKINSPVSVPKYYSVFSVHKGQKTSGTNTYLQLKEMVSLCQKERIIRPALMTGYRFCKNFFKSTISYFKSRKTRQF